MARKIQFSASPKLSSTILSLKVLALVPPQRDAGHGCDDQPGGGQVGGNVLARRRHEQVDEQQHRGPAEDDQQLQNDAQVELGGSWISGIATLIARYTSARRVPHASSKP